MRLALQTVICCCVFTMVLPLVKGATGDFNPSLKKRFRVWLQSRMKRDLHHSLVTDSEQDPESHVGPQLTECEDAFGPSSSFDLNSRSRRSSGCALVTCAFHDLLHRLQQLNDNNKEPIAPEEKILPTGYGRRRRSLLDVAQRLGWSIGTNQGGQGHKTTQAVA